MISPPFCWRFGSSLRISYFSQIIYRNHKQFPEKAYRAIRSYTLLYRILAFRHIKYWKILYRCSGTFRQKWHWIFGYFVYWFLPLTCSTFCNKKYPSPEGPGRVIYFLALPTTLKGYFFFLLLSQFFKKRICASSSLFWSLSSFGPPASNTSNRLMMITHKISTIKIIIINFLQCTERWQTHSIFRQFGCSTTGHRLQLSGYNSSRQQGSLFLRLGTTLSVGALFRPMSEH